MSLIREPDAALVIAEHARHDSTRARALPGRKKTKTCRAKSNQPHAGISHGREKTKLQSGTETGLISEGDRAGAKSEEQARMLAHTVAPLGNVWVLQHGNPWNRQKTGATHTHTEAHEYAGCSALPRLIITAVREHPAGCSYVVEERERRRGGSENGRTVKCERGGEASPSVRVCARARRCLVCHSKV